jgi:uncharacterized Tic20 family protein
MKDNQSPVDQVENLNPEESQDRHQEFNNMNALLHSSAVLSVYVPFISMIAGLFFWTTIEFRKDEIREEVKKVLDFSILMYLINFLLGFQTLFLINTDYNEFIASHQSYFMIFATKLIPAINILFVLISAIQVIRAYKGLRTRYPLSKFSIINFLIKKAEQEPKK